MGCAAVDRWKIKEPLESFKTMNFKRVEIRNLKKTGLKLHSGLQGALVHFLSEMMMALDPVTSSQVKNKNPVGGAAAGFSSFLLSSFHHSSCN